MEGIQIETTYNGGDTAPVRYLMLPRKTSSAKHGLHLTESLVKHIP